MFFAEENGVLTARSQYETLRIEAWGKDALRVRATQYSGFSGRVSLNEGWRPGVEAHYRRRLQPYSTL